MADDSGVHICLRAPDVPSVDAFHAAALKAGGASDGDPGVRMHYDEGYYAAFIRDPDGNRIEAVEVLAIESMIAGKTALRQSEKAAFPSSPVSGVDAPSKERARDRVLSDDELRWLWRACEKIELAVRSVGEVAATHWPAP